MAIKLYSRIVLCSKNQFMNKSLFVGANNTRKLSTYDVPCQDIKIPVEYGHLRGKLWGSGSERPILALHGWQDNSGTWDPLIPMFYKETKTTRPILALDFPGHGQSSWYPAGMHYFAWDYPQLIMYLKEYFKWDKVSIMAHSMGSIAGFRFSSTCCDDTDFYIAFDHIVFDDYIAYLDSVVKKFEGIFKKNLIAMKRLNEEPPSYTIEEMIEKYHVGTRKSVSLEAAHYLIKRGSKPSSKHPNKYYFSRDPRLKNTLFIPEDKTFSEALAMRLKCPTLYIKATDSRYASDEFSVGMREIIEKNNPHFRAHFVPGTHHVHLNNPEVVLPHIVKFLREFNFI